MATPSTAGDLSLGTGIIAGVASSATYISLALTATGVIAGIVFHVIALRDRRKQIKLDTELLDLKQEENKQNNNNN